MLNTVELGSWEEFEKIIKLRIEWQIDNRVDKDSGTSLASPFLFRGQPNSDWGLDTTLERNLGGNKTVVFYHNLISQILPELETFTGKKWNIASEITSNIIGIHELSESVQRLLPLEYMSYLRHHGFPSPLLDWSYSPYVAAYFAFRDMSSNAEKIAVFEYYQAYNYEPEKVRRSIITPLWSLEGIRNNKRHFLQQSIYTLCVQEGEQASFSHHETVYKVANESAANKKHSKAEFITKYVLPASERENALMHLEMHNINSFSLIGSEESLLETLFLRVASPYKALKVKAPNLYSSLEHERGHF